MDKKISVFRKFALISTLTTYFLIFIGGLVRVSGAGLGCPDWPKCFGRWIPPIHESQIPQDFNAASFNLTLAWIEYINRLIGMITGFLILITAILAIKYFRNIKRIWIPAFFSVILVAIQGWYGSVVVASHLQPVTVSIHLLLALLIVSLLVYVTQHAYYLEFGAVNTTSRKQNVLKPFVLLLWGLAIIQIILGTQVRSKIDVILEEFPLLMGNELIMRIGGINIFHAILGIALVLLTIFILFKAFKIGSDFIKVSAWIIVVLMIIQILIGATLEIAGLPQVLQLFHLWIASLIIGVVLILYTELSHQN